MTTVTLSSKGQIIIPVDLRTELQVHTGDSAEFVQIAPGHYEFMAASSEVTALKGMFGKPKATVTIEQMNEAIARTVSQ
jgi:bifunctional DNA-binding transcriptional regulator/antitoxin component of YhaV-PrlF toxin-antitoxin module